MGFHQEYQHIHNVSFSRRDRKSDGIFEKRMAKKIVETSTIVDCITNQIVEASQTKEKTGLESFALVMS